MNKLLQQIKLNNDIIYNEVSEAIDENEYWDEEKFKELLSVYTIPELETLVEIVNKIQEVEPESNGRFNACNEMREVLEYTIKQLKTN